MRERSGQRMKEEEEKRSEEDELLSGRSLLDLSPWLGRRESETIAWAKEGEGGRRGIR